MILRDMYISCNLGLRIFSQRADTIQRNMDTSQMTEAQQPSTAIAEYSVTAAALATLRDRFKGVVYDVTKPADMKAAKEARAELRGLRTDLEKTRKAVKEESLQRGRLIDAEAKSITADISALEDPIDAQIKLEEGRKAREAEEARVKEDARIANIQALVNDFVKTPGEHARSSAAQISLALSMLRGNVPTAEVFMEFLDHAKTERQKALDMLQLMLEATTAKENAAKIEEENRTRVAAENARQQAELEALRKEKAERERVENERIAKERAEHEAKMRAEREAEEKRQAAVREKFAAEQKEREDAARKETEARLAKERADAAKREAAERERAEKAQARTLLELFVSRYGKRPEFAKVVKAINEHLKG